MRCAMETAFCTIMETRDWGVETIMMPSSGRLWHTASGTSPVPGGISTNMKSASPQETSSQNCFTTPEITGPRQNTGSVSFSNSRFSDMTFVPSAAI